MGLGSEVAMGLGGGVGAAVGLGVPAAVLWPRAACWMAGARIPGWWARLEDVP